MWRILACLICVCLLSPGSGSSYPTLTNAPITQDFHHLGHVGVDFGVPVGTAIFAVMDGMVLLTVEDSPTYGRYIEVYHLCDGYVSLYAHLSVILVKRGQEVNAGDLIGLSGGRPDDAIDGDGMSDGAHLHFEVRPRGHLDTNLYTVDPLQYLFDHMIPAQELPEKPFMLGKLMVY